AGEAASLAGEPERAIEQVDAALGHPDVAEGERARWLMRRARYLLEAGREAESLAAYRELAERTDDLALPDRPRLLVAHARALALAGHYGEAGRVAETALAQAR